MYVTWSKLIRRTSGNGCRQKWEVMIRARQQYRRDAWLAHHAPQASPACPPLLKRRTASAAVTAQQSLTKPNPYAE